MHGAQVRDRMAVSVRTDRSHVRRTNMSAPAASLGIPMLECLRTRGLDAAEDLVAATTAAAGARCTIAWLHRTCADLQKHAA
jgi:hypothetical protein